jgi:hypothetical protein
VIEKAARQESDHGLRFSSDNNYSKPSSENVHESGVIDIRSHHEINSKIRMN